jgi:hypothetical protein
MSRQPSNEKLLSDEKEDELLKMDNKERLENVRKRLRGNTRDAIDNNI